MKTNREKPSVLIFGRNGSSNLCMARSLGRAGYDVQVLRIFQSKPKALNLMQYLVPEARSKYVRSYHSCICDSRSSIIAEKLLSLAKPGQKMLLIPTCDMAASAADEYLQQLEPHFWVPNIAGSPGAVNRIMQKAVQKELAREAGLPVVNSCLIKTEKGVYSLPDTVQYPCFIKPNVSKNSIKSTICRCGSEPELRSVLNRFSASGDIEMLVEDFVEIRQEYGLLGVSTKDGAVCPGFLAKERIGSEDRRGVTMVGRLLPCEQQKKLIGDIARFVHSLGFEGLFDVDIIETTEGKWYFVELNLRYGAAGYAVAGSGLNLPAMYADYRINGTPIDVNCTLPQTGRRFASDKVLLDEYARDCISMAEVRQIEQSVDFHFIRSLEDPMPYLHFRKFYLFGSLTRILFRLKRAMRKQAEISAETRTPEKVR